PVDDQAASQFAVTLYRHLLGLDQPANRPKPMHEAMKEARSAIANSEAAEPAPGVPTSITVTPSIGLLPKPKPLNDKLATRPVNERGVETTGRLVRQRQE